MPYNQAVTMSEREELEKAIANLEAHRATLGDTAVAAAIAGIKMQLAALESSRKPQEQRKQVTVLFADVFGYTAMSETMDAEDVQETMNGLWQRVDKAITDYNGRIDKHIGDAVMALWGADEAREDDPEQAIRAALAMQTAVAAFANERQVPLQMRIGLNTGPVKLGEVGTTAEFTAIGDTVNTASRLERAAPVGGILISHDTYRHVRGVFDVELQEPLTVKGKTGALQVYVVKRAKTRAFRTRTRGVEGVETRMVGRDEELRTLQRVWQTAVTTSQTTLITITGEAGVGKSRLLYEFEQWLDLQPEIVTLLKGRSAEQTRGAPYFLLRDLLATRFDIRESDPIDEVRQKFAAGVAGIPLNAVEMKSHFLGQWLGYDFSHSDYVAAIGDDAEQLKNRGLLYWSQFLRAMAAVRPLLLFLEDIHWADTPSLDAILDSLRREPALPMMVVALTRPSLFEHRPTWQELERGNKVKTEGLAFKEPYYHFVALNPLPAAANHELLAEILKKAASIPQELFNLVASRAEGNPFYMEELVKMLIDDGVIMPDEETWQIDLTQLNENHIPETLTGVLQARLDRLAVEERVTLQRASVVGRVFWDTAVQQLGDDPNEQAQLAPLQKRELIFKQSESAFRNTRQYLFKHDLLRDVTYQTVLKKERQVYHGRAAVWLVEAAEMNGRLDEFTAIIAEHYLLADRLDRAAHWYGQAGQHAASRFAHEEAIRYLNLALDYTPDDDHTTRYTLLQAREKVYDMQGNRQAQWQDLRQLAALANSLSVLDQATVRIQQARYAQSTGDYQQAIIHAQSAIESGNLENDKNLIAQGYKAWGLALWRQGQYSSAQEKFHTGLHLAETIGDTELRASCLNGLGNVAFFQGDYANAQATYQQALTLFHEINDRRRIGLLLNNLGGVDMERGDYAAAREYLQQAVMFFNEIGDRRGEGRIQNNLGVIALSQGDFVAAKKCFAQDLAICREIGDRLGQANSLLNLGIVSMEQGEYAVGRERHLQALTIQREIGNRNGEGINLTELGYLEYSQYNLSAANAYFKQALAIHQELNQPHYLVDDWVGLAQLSLVQGDQESAGWYGQQFLNYLQENPRLDGAIHPMRTFRFVWEVMISLSQNTAAHEVLTIAAQILQEYLDKNSDPALQKIYLSQPHHRVLWAAWQQGMDG